MDPRNSPIAPSRSRLQLVSGVALGLSAALVLGGLILFLAVWKLPDWGGFLRSGETRIRVDQPTVVYQVRQLGRLESVVYTMDKVIEGERLSRWLPDFLAGDRLLMIVHGQVVAGVDLEKLDPDQVRVQDREVSLRLPKAEVFWTRVDNQRTRVFSRQTGWFSPVDPFLETRVRREAEEQLRMAALGDGILDAAEVNARSALTSLLRGFGFESIEVR